MEQIEKLERKKADSLRSTTELVERLQHEEEQASDKRHRDTIAERKAGAER